MFASDPPPLVKSRGSRPRADTAALPSRTTRERAVRAEGPIFVHQVDLDIDSGPSRSLLKGIDHRCRDVGKLPLVVTPAFSPELAQIGHYVGGHSSSDDPDVGAGLLVDAAQGHGGDGLGRRLDCASATLGFYAGVGRAPAEHCP